MRDGTLCLPSCICNPVAREVPMKSFPTRLFLVADRVRRYKPRRWAPTAWQPWCVRCGDLEWLGATRRKVGSVVVAVQPYRFGSPPILHTFPQWVVTMQKRKVPTGDSAGKMPQASLSTKVLLKYQNLVQHLALSQYDDGSPRSPGVLILFATGTSWRCVIKDPDTTAKLVITQESLDELLGAADLLLGSPDTMWEIDQYTPSSRKGGKRK